MKYVLVSLSLLVFPLSNLKCMSSNESRQNWNGKEYHRNSTMQYDSSMAIVNTLHIAPDDEILDVGCGSGRIAAELAQLVAQGSVHGIDASDSQIATACEQWNGQKNLTFEVVDGQNIPFQNRFNYVVSFHAIHWMQKQQDVFNGCFRSLKSGGKFVCYTCGHDPENSIKKAFGLMARQEKWAMLRTLNPDTQLYPQDKSRLEKMLQESGFEEIEVEECELQHAFTPDDLKNFIRTLIGGYKDLTRLKETQPETVNNLVMDLVETYKTIVPFDDNGKLVYKVSGLIAKAQKSTNS